MAALAAPIRLLTIAWLALAAAPAAHASTVVTETVQDPFLGPLTNLRFTETAGEANSVTAVGGEGGATVRDTSAALTPGNGCSAGAEAVAFCPAAEFFIASFTLGAGDDRLVVEGLLADVDAGPGDDTVTTGDGADQIDGGPGSDTLDAGAGENPAPLSGDTITYAGRRRGVTVDLVGETGGEAGENDVLADFEVVFTGRGADTVRGSAEGNYIATGAGRDVVRAGGGTDLVEGGAGADRLEGGAGADEIFGGGGADIIDCGPGRDRATVDRTDRVRRCERVNRV